MFNRNRNRIVLILLLLSVAYFAVFYFPNASASTDSKMVLIFQPDEAVPLPYVLDMIKPADSIKQALINFAFYDYYFYGFPYFAVSATVLLPLKWAGQLQNTPLVMIVLRQIVSVFPLLAAIWVIVFAQTRFRSYKAVVLFLLLVSLPAVTQNNFWWHPDGLAILFTTLALFFLSEDALCFGRYFYLAAVLCGIAAMTKGIGFFFFLAVLVYLSVGYFGRKASIKKIILSAGGYLVVMALVYFASNPILIYAGVRRRFFEVMSTQSVFLTKGYEVFYPKGFLVSLPKLMNNFGGWPLLLAALIACILGIWRGPNRLLHTLILAWLIPLSVMDFAIIHFKFQYWLPVALPLFSSLAVVLPNGVDLKRLADRRITKNRSDWELLLGKGGLTLLVVVQVFFFTQSNIVQINGQINRAENSKSILFYNRAKQSLAMLPDEKYYVYHDVLMYVPENSPWVTESIFEMLDYAFIDERSYDILLLMHGRISDYLNPAVEGIDPEKLAKARTFYQDARDSSIKGYHLVYNDTFGLVFIKNALYSQYFTAVPFQACMVAILPRYINEIKTAMVY